MKFARLLFAALALACAGSAYGQTLGSVTTGGGNWPTVVAPDINDDFTKLYGTPFLVIGNQTTFSTERGFATSGCITGTDGGAGGSYTVSITSACVGASLLATDSVSADELNALGVEAELEAVLDLADLQGSLTLAGDVDGAHGSNDLDEAAVETELEGVLDLADMQGDLPLGTKTSGNYAAGDAEAGAALTGDSATGFFSIGTLEDARVDGSLEADELVLAGDVDGTANSNDLDEAAVESELESVLDLADLQGDLALGTKTSGNYMSGLSAGTGIAVTHTPGEGSTGTVALDYSSAAGNPALGAGQCRFATDTTAQIVCEGTTADTFEARIIITDPTADRAFTIPDADSNPVQPSACGGTDKVTGISSTGVISCAADEGGAGSGDNIRVEDTDNGGTFTAADNADFEDSGDIDFVLNTGTSPDQISALIRANSVALGTDTTGNYAAGDGEAGAATTGDSATAFFSSGTIELARGGTGASLSDPGGHRITGWDDTGNAIVFKTAGGGLTTDADSIDCGASTDTAQGCVELATTSEADAGSDTTRAITAAGLRTAASGKRTIAIPAGALRPRATNGCDSSSAFTGTNVEVPMCGFDPNTDERAQFTLAMPKSADESAGIDAQFVWSSTGASGNAIWTIACVAVSDDDPVDGTMGTAQSVTDGVTAANDQMVSSFTSTVTPGGTWVEGDTLYCQVTRDADNGSDTLANDARFLAVRIRYTINALKDD